jgi:uncharacterized tellurite resistance protein B-like protein
MLAKLKSLLFDADGRGNGGAVAHSHEELHLGAGALMVEAARIFGFTRTLRQHFTHEERIEMMEMLWEVAYADGMLHDYEASLLRQITGLLYVTDQESGAARKRVRARLGIHE